MRQPLRWILRALFTLILCSLVLSPYGYVHLRAALAVGPQQSGPIALTPNDARLVAVNPDSNTVSIFNALANPPAKLAETAVGSEPVSVAVHPLGTKAYVANAISGTVSVVNLVSFAVDKIIPVGAEPMGVAVSPNGTKLYVANSASNSVSVLDATTDTVITTLNLTLAGNSPRAIGITNDGDLDDTDETVFVAMFFGGLRTGKSSVHEGQDDQREGRVLAISVATNTLVVAPNPVGLAPMASAGFNANGTLAPAVGQTPLVASTNPQTFAAPTGAFPNQLASIAIHPLNGRAYVVSTGASPNGPLRFNHMVQGLVSVFDTATRTETTAAQTDALVRRTAPLNLNQGINLGTTPAPRLFLSNPVAITWRPNGSDAWVAVQNSDLIVRLTVDAGGVPTIGNPLVAGPSTLTRVDLTSVAAGGIPGKAPQGIAINSTGTRAYVTNFVSRSVTTVDISTGTSPAILSTVQSSALPAAGTLDATAQLGAELFYTGRGPQERMSSESWGGCITCHPNGRSDNVTWMFDAGPRQTIPLDSTFSRTNPVLDQRILNWSAVRDENHDFELNTRGVFGGRGLIDDDRLFLAIGGSSIPAGASLIEQFHQVTGLVTATNDLQGLAPLPSLASFGPRRDFGIATLDDDRVYIIGGRSGAPGSLVPATDAVLEFNPRTNVLRRRSSSGFTLRHSLGAAAVNTADGQRIYAIGGYGSTSSSASPLSTVQEYNPATDTWRTVASLPTAIAQFGITVAGGVNSAEPLQLIHAVSGNKGTEASPSLLDALTYTVQRFQADPVGNGTWSTFNPAGLTPRRNHGAATALRGVSSRIFVIGGQDVAGTVLSSVEEYAAQGVTVVASPHTPLPFPRAEFGISSSLSTNQIYVMGGFDAGAEQTAIFEYSIANNGPVPGPVGTPSGTWATRGNLSFARRGVGVSMPPGVTNFLPARNVLRDTRQDAIAVWVALKVRSSRPSVSAADPDATAGRTLFSTSGLVQPGVSCATCHAGPKWTRSQVDYPAPPSTDLGLGFGNERVVGAELRQTQTQGPNVLNNVGTFILTGRQNEVRFNGADISQAIAPLGANGFNIPSLLSVTETAPYFYNGLAQTLDEVFNGTQDNTGSGVRHHFVTNATDRTRLIAFLRSIDATTPIFPVNSAPNISDITSQTTPESTPTPAIPFFVADAETAAGSLVVTATSSNLTLVPNANIVLGGTGANRTLAITPAPNQVGATVITVTVSDGTLASNDPFLLTVTDRPFVTITGPTAAPTFISTSSFLRLTGLASDNLIPDRADSADRPLAPIAAVTWATDRGASGTAEGTTNWAADVPVLAGVTVITVTATDTGGVTATDVLTVTVNNLLYLLAEGATGDFFDLDILLGNPNAVVAPVAITYLKPDGTVVNQALNLPATSRTTIGVESLAGLTATAVSAVVNSTAALPLLVERTMLWDSRRYGAHTGPAVDGARTRWLFAEGSQGFFDTFVLLANANNAPANVQLTFLRESGAPVVVNRIVPANARANFWALESPLLVGTSFSIVVDSDLPIIAERAMYFPSVSAPDPSGRRTFEGGHESPGVAQPSRTWFHAEGATGPFFDTFILVGNSNAIPANVTFTYLLSTGQTVVRNVVIPANTRLTVNVEVESPLLAQAEVSITVTSDVPVISERAMYWPGAFTQWFEAHNSFGVTSLATKWGLAEGRVGNPPGTPAGLTPDYGTFILLANPNAVAADVRITFLRTNGTTVVKNFPVGATSRFNVWVNVQVPELGNENFSAIVESLGGQPIAVERALYNSSGGVPFAAGTNGTGIRVP